MKHLCLFFAALSVFLSCSGREWSKIDLLEFYDITRRDPVEYLLDAESIETVQAYLRDNIIDSLYAVENFPADGSGRMLVWSKPGTDFAFSEIDRYPINEVWTFVYGRVEDRNPLISLFLPGEDALIIENEKQGERFLFTFLLPQRE